MRHRKSGRHFNRNSSHRKAMMQNLTNSLFKHELIKTTVPKAKELRRVAEPLITMAKEDSVHTRRLAFSRMRDKEMVGKLFTVLGPRYQARPGGYLRILKCGFRAGDKAPMAYVELVGRGEEVSAPAPKPAKKKAAKTTKPAAPKVEKKAETVASSGSDITDIEGIGKAMATKLEAAGVNSISSLLDSCGSAEIIAALAEKSGVSVNNLTKWSAAADLLRVEGIEPQRAELLVATGITSVQDLASKDSSELANSMIELNKEKNLTKTEDSADTVATWISAAAELPTKLS